MLLSRDYIGFLALMHLPGGVWQVTGDEYQKSVGPALPCLLLVGLST